MAIARKNRRPISVRGREFLWWVYEDLENLGAMTLAVASADKAFLVRYEIAQTDETRHLTVLGQEFPGLPARRSWRRVRCPAFVAGDSVTPSHVRQLIDWCLHAKRDLVQVDWTGRDVLPG
jgi:hypothetical protein